MLQPVVEDPSLTPRVLQSRIQKEITHITHTGRYIRRVTADEIQFEITYTFSEWGVGSAHLGNRHGREPEAIYLTSWDSTDSMSFKPHLEVAGQVPVAPLGCIAIR